MSKGGLLISVTSLTKLKRPYTLAEIFFSVRTSGLRCCVQVDVASGGVGSNPTSDGTFEDS